MQNARISYTISYKGIVVGGFNEYHPEKVDVSITKTIDHIPDEPPELTQKRVDDLEFITEVLKQDIEKAIAKNVNEILNNVNKKQY